VKVGDLVQFGNCDTFGQNRVGIVFAIDETIDHADPDVRWCGVLWANRFPPRTVTASRYLEVISESR